MAFPSTMIPILLLTRSLCASKIPKCARDQQKVHKLYEQSTLPAFKIQDLTSITKGHYSSHTSRTYCTHYT